MDFATQLDKHGEHLRQYTAIDSEALSVWTFSTAVKFAGFFIHSFPSRTLNRECVSLTRSFELRSVMLLGLLVGPWSPKDSMLSFSSFVPNLTHGAPRDDFRTLLVGHVPQAILCKSLLLAWTC